MSTAFFTHLPAVKPDPGETCQQVQRSSLVPQILAPFLLQFFRFHCLAGLSNQVLPGILECLANFGVHVRQGHAFFGYIDADGRFDGRQRRLTSMCLFFLKLSLHFNPLLGNYATHPRSSQAVDMQVPVCKNDTMKLSKQGISDEYLCRVICLAFASGILKQRTGTNYQWQ